MGKGKVKLLAGILGSIAFLAGELVIPCEDVQAAGKKFKDFDVTKDSVVVLYTNDIHGGLSNDEGYSGTADSLGIAGVAALREEASMKAADVTVVDVGDALQGSIVCSQSEGSDMLKIMDAAGYDYYVAGNHEFDYGMEKLLEFPGEVKGKFLAVNFADLREDDLVWEPFDIVSYETEKGEFKVAYLGIMTPENITKGSVSNFQDEEENFIYDFHGKDLSDFYQIIQNGIDEAYEQGADIVIGLGHLGDEEIAEGWSSVEVIENTTGLKAFIDGHAHSVIEERICKDSEGADVVLTSTGTKLNNIGTLIMTEEEDGEISISSHLVNELSEEETASEAYKTIDELVTSVQEKYAEFLVVEGKSDYSLYIYDPETQERLIRKQETNLGDFVTDAFRAGLEADIAFSNGGNIRADLPEGEITYLDIMNVLPWSSNMVKLEATGQQLLDRTFCCDR